MHADCRHPGAANCLLEAEGRKSKMRRTLRHDKGGIADGLAAVASGALASSSAVVCGRSRGHKPCRTRGTSGAGVRREPEASGVRSGVPAAVLAFAWGYGTALQDWLSARQLAWFLSFMYVVCGG